MNRILLALALLVSTSLVAEPVAYNKAKDTGKITASGSTFTHINIIGEIQLQVEYVIAGSPTISSIVLSGCMRGGTCAVLNTYSSSTSTIVGVTGLYDSYTVVPSWTGGVSPSVTINWLGATRASGGGGISTSAGVIALFSGCSGSLLLGADGACHAGGGTLSASGTPANHQIAIWASPTTIKAFSTATIDDLGNAVFTSVGVGTAPAVCGAASACQGATEASTAATPTASQDACRADSTAHGWKCTNNNGAEFVSAMNLASTAVAARGLSFTMGDPTNSSALTTSEVSYLTVPFACTIAGYNIAIDAGTITLKTWKVATGTAIPTSGNSISTSGVGVASGTAIHSTTVTDFTTTTVAANDIVAVAITAVATAKFVNFTLECDTK